MAADILITLPIAALFVLIALRCLHGFGWRPAGLEKAFPRWASPAPPADGYAAPGVEGLYPGPGAAGVPVRGQPLLGVAPLRPGPVPGGGGAVLVPLGRRPLHQPGGAGLRRLYGRTASTCFWCFYPAYVWLLRAARVLIPHTLLAGMLLSSLCYAGGCCFVYRLARLFYPHAVARDGVLFLSLFPFSFFFGAAMTEGLFLLSTAAACYYACRGKWLPFGLWGALAALTRMTGVLVLAPAILTLLGREKPLESPPGPLPGPYWETAAAGPALPAAAPAGHPGVPGPQLRGGRRPLCLPHPPGALVPGAHVGLPGAALRVGLPAPLLECLQRLGHLAAHAPAVPGVLCPPPLGDPPGPAGQPGASGLRLLLSDGQLLPVLAALRRAVPVLRVRVLPAGGQPHGKPPRPAPGPVGRGGGAVGDLPVRPPVRRSDHVKKHPLPRQGAFLAVLVGCQGQA